MRFSPVLTVLVVLLLTPALAHAAGGNITGTVSLDGPPANSACVDVLDNNANVVGSATTTAAGTYDAWVEEAGTYNVRFGDCGTGYTTTEWAYDISVVADGVTTGVDAYLHGAGVITGRVESETSQQLVGACVKAEDQWGSVVAQATTDSSGDYELKGILPGEVTVQFRGCSAGNYMVQYWQETSSPAAAKPVTVTAGHTTGGVHAVMVHAGRITGHIQDANGAPVENACVMAGVDGLDAGSGSTDLNGDYEILEVPPAGNYEVSATGCASTTYMVEYASGPLAAPAGTTVVNFTLWHPAFITGHVFGDGSPLAWICVTAKNTATGEEFHEHTVGPYGYYEVNRMHPGTYHLTFSDCHSTGDWVTAKTTGVVLGDGQVLFDLDKTLEHPAPAVPGGGSGGADPADPGTGHDAGGSVDSGAASADPPAGGGPGGGASVTPPPVHACKVPKLVGLSLAKAKRALANAGCALGKVSKRHPRHRATRGRVLKQKAKRGSSRPAGFRVALTVAR